MRGARVRARERAVCVAHVCMCARESAYVSTDSIYTPARGNHFVPGRWWQYAYVSCRSWQYARRVCVRERAQYACVSCRLWQYAWPACVCERESTVWVLHVCMCAKDCAYVYTA